MICLLFGGETPFDEDTLADLYPGRGDYVEAVTAAADEAVEAGFVPEEDAERLVADVEDAEVPGLPT